MRPRTQHFGEALVAQGFISREQLAFALELQQKEHRPIGRILLEKNFLSETSLVRGWSAHLGVPSWDFSRETIDAGAARIIPPEVCREHGLVAVHRTQDLLQVAMKNPFDIEASELVRNITGLRVEPVFAIPERIDEAIASLSALDPGKPELDALVEQAIREFGRTDVQDTEAILSKVESRPVIAVVNQILAHAIRLGASDVHIEPSEDYLNVRYRVDGDMHAVLRFPRAVQPMVVARLKILAELDLVEYRTPQDGRITASIDGRDVDMRVSVIPNEDGQRIVLRILERRTSLRRLDELGLNGSNLNIFRRMINRPHGLVLVTGPTGSGKTTTLYAALQELKRVSSNIMTCEDPVEYKIDGISQTNINEKVGLTFASSLRSMLRQDPDIILVGEIRDKDTAETALRASMTGHLVLSTLHCNSAPSAVPRLIDMGVDPFLLSTCLVGVTGQRLLRKLCPDCNGASLEEDGCPACHETGYRGRFAVHEIMAVSARLAEAIASRAPMSALEELASEIGYVPMVEAAREFVASGVTSERELSRVLVTDEFSPSDSIMLPRAA